MYLTLRERRSKYARKEYWNESYGTELELEGLI